LGTEVPSQIVADAVVAHARLPLTETTMLESEIEKMSTAEIAFSRLAEMRPVGTDLPELIEAQLKGEAQIQVLGNQSSTPKAGLHALGGNGGHQSGNDNGGDKKPKPGSAGYDKYQQKHCPTGQYWNRYKQQYVKSNPICPKGSECKDFRNGECTDKFHPEKDPTKRAAMHAERSAAIAKNKAEAAKGK
jgi:hypothetical protein